MRFDIPHQRFYFFGYELWISEFAIIFFSLMFLMFLVAAASLLYGRVYCGYLCPQMIFSEASVDLENELKRIVNRYFAKQSTEKRNLIHKLTFYSLLTLASVFLAFVFVSYFVTPKDLFHSLASFDVKTITGLTGAITTAIIFLDFALVKQRFCTTVCPYGYLQGVLGDKNTLVVNYRDEKQECIECKKCVKVCPMGIDIRKSPYQFECIHCGECIDACTDVLGKLGHPTLISYTWGEKGLEIDKKMPWHKKLGFLDAKRLVIVLVLLFYATGLFLALSMRKPVLVKLTPNRTTLYKIEENGMVSNKFRLVIANRGKQEAELKLSVANLPSSKVELQPVKLKVGENLEQEFQVVADKKSLTPGVNHFQIISQTVPYNQTDKFDLTFIAPMGKEAK
jgi:cytochrome c oxidase accessory protein FixG